MVSLVLIGTGIILIIYGLFGVFSEQQYYKNIVNGLSKKVRKDLVELEDELLESRKRLLELIQELDLIIDELYLKEEGIKEALANLRVEQVERNQENFKKLLNEKLETANKREIPAKYSEIMALFKQGLTAEQIAKKMDMGVRETDLICKLYGREKDVAT